MRRRIITILMFPIIAALFIIGWILYAFGREQKNLEKKPKTKPNDLEKPELASDDGIEMGLIEEREEEITT